MAIKFQYNKTSLNDIEKQLKVRTRALPTIKSKEAALRMEVKKARQETESLKSTLNNLINSYDYMVALWGEFDNELLKVSDVILTYSKIAGVKLPKIKDIIFQEKEYNLFDSPIWFPNGIALLKGIAQAGLHYELATTKLTILERARKKTTQKVNLYEKVQIPGFQEAILKIKRFMEDEENLSKAAQKIVKTRQQQQEEIAL